MKTAWEWIKGFFIGDGVLERPDWIGQGGLSDNWYQEQEYDRMTNPMYKNIYANNIWND